MNGAAADECLVLVGRHLIPDPQQQGLGQCALPFRQPRCLQPCGNAVPHLLKSALFHRWPHERPMLLRGKAFVVHPAAGGPLARIKPARIGHLGDRQHGRRQHQPITGPHGAPGAVRKQRDQQPSARRPRPCPIHHGTCLGPCTHDACPCRSHLLHFHHHAIGRLKRPSHMVRATQGIAQRLPEHAYAKHQREKHRSGNPAPPVLLRPE